MHGGGLTQDRMAARHSRMDSLISVSLRSSMYDLPSTAISPGQYWSSRSTNPLSQAPETNCSRPRPVETLSMWFRQRSNCPLAYLVVRCMGRIVVADVFEKNAATSVFHCLCREGMAATRFTLGFADTCGHNWGGWRCQNKVFSLQRPPTHPKPQHLEYALRSTMPYKPKLYRNRKPEHRSRKTQNRKCRASTDQSVERQRTQSVERQ
eukprot:6255395-Amphidinium_carterae.3